MIPLSKEPSSAVAVWDELSVLFQLTVEPLIIPAGLEYRLRRHQSRLRLGDLITVVVMVESPA
jgi:hypothetical protein